MIFRDHTLLFFHQAVNMFSVIELCFLRRGSVGTDCLRNNIFFLPLLRRLHFSALEVAAWFKLISERREIT